MHKSGKGQVSIEKFCKITLSVALLSLSSTISAAHASSYGFAGFHGQEPNWVGTCSAELDVDIPLNGTTNGTLTITCNNVVNVKEDLVGYFDPGNNQYDANVVDIKNITGFDYDKDGRFEMQLSSDGCEMSGTDTDDSNSYNVSFSSNAQGCSQQ